MLPLLRDVNVVVPCLPGYPYADPLTTTGMSTVDHGAMSSPRDWPSSAIDRYVVSGGDIGSSVARVVAAAYPDRVAALHLTDIPYLHLFTVEASELTDGGAEPTSTRDGSWQFAEGAYALKQATKPHTLAVGLADSPAGLAAWIVEKLRSWSDCDGDVESVVPARRPAHLADLVLGDRDDRYVVLAVRRGGRADRPTRSRCPPW